MPLKGGISLETVREAGRTWGSLGSDRHIERWALLGCLGDGSPPPSPLPADSPLVRGMSQLTVLEADSVRG